MSANVLSIIAIFIYAACAINQGRRLLKPVIKPARHHILHSAIFIALILHGIAVYKFITPGSSFDLGILPMASLSSWCITSLLLLSSLRRPLDNLFALLLPITILCTALPLIFVSSKPINTLDNGVIAHILLSMLAQGTLAIAALQATLLATQEKHLKQRVTKGFIQSLPPLQTMENLLFEILWLGFIFLGLSLLTGAIYLNDIFAQHLIHKTILSIAAWIALGILLWGRYKLGWRSQTAARWTFIVFILLMAAYFGSKFVLEIILQR